MTLIEVFRRREFGNDRFYPSNDAAKVLLGLMARQTFNEREIKDLRHAGFDIKQVTDPELT